jgi:hypothetical protein
MSTPMSRRFQFSLKWLLVGMVGIALVCAAIRPAKRYYLRRQIETDWNHIRLLESMLNDPAHRDSGDFHADLLAEKLEELSRHRAELETY